MDNVVCISNNMTPVESDECLEINHNKKIELSETNMAPLPPRAQRHLWLRYQVEGYTEEIVHDFEQRLDTIFGRQVNRVHVLDFAGLTEEMRQTLADRMRMVYTGDEGQELFTSGARHRMTWKQFILALGLHTAEEMVEDGFEAYWGQAPEKVTATDLFYLRSMDQGTANVSYLLAQYLFRHAEGRKSGARISEGHFIWRLAKHFGLRQSDVAAGALEGAEGDPDVVESAQTILAPVQAP
ncbi:hypothetical protein Tco_1570993 [Tanacetum coccineum]